MYVIIKSKNYVAKIRSFFSAIKNGNITIVEEVIKEYPQYINAYHAGKKVISIPKEDITPLIYAINNGQANIAQLLLSQGADPNIQTDQGNTALMTFIQNSYQHHNVTGYNQIIDDLFKYKADPNIQNKYGNTSLMIVANESFGNYDNSDILSLLLQNRANPDTKNNADTQH